MRHDHPQSWRSCLLKIITKNGFSGQPFFFMKNITLHEQTPSSPPMFVVREILEDRTCKRTATGAECRGWCCSDLLCGFSSLTELLATRQRGGRGQHSWSCVGWECKAIRESWMKEMQFVNRDQEVRELDLERLGGNICEQFQRGRVGEGGRGREEGQNIHLRIY